MDNSQWIAVGGLVVAALALSFTIYREWVSNRTRIRVYASRSGFLDESDGTAKQGISIVVVNESQIPVYIAGSGLWGLACDANPVQGMAQILANREEMKRDRELRHVMRRANRFDIPNPAREARKVEAKNGYQHSMVAPIEQLDVVDPRCWGVHVSFQTGRRISLDAVDMNRGYRAWFILLRRATPRRRRFALNRCPAQLSMKKWYFLGPFKENMSRLEARIESLPTDPKPGEVDQGTTRPRGVSPFRQG